MSDELKWERENFFKLASDPHFPNRMAFEVARAKRDKDETFSVEAMKGMLDNVEAFTLARVFAEWQRTGIAPQELHVEVNVSFKNKGQSKLANGNLPWWQLADKEQGLLEIDADVLKETLPLDGEHRGA